MSHDTNRRVADTDFEARVARLSPAKRALLMQRITGADGKSAAVDTVPSARDDRAVLSFAQQRLWVVDRYSGVFVYRVGTGRLLSRWSLDARNGRPTIRPR